MTQAVAGWYPDPAGSPSHRWWDGQQWTDQLQAAPTQPGWAQPPAYGQPAYGRPAYGQPAHRGPAQPQGSLWHRNQYSFITMIVSLIYIAIAFESHFVFIGVIPILMTVRAFNRKERLAIPAAALAGLSVIVIITSLITR